MSHMDSSFFLCSQPFDEVNDFLVASEHSNINGLNGILTGLLYGFQTLISINFNNLIFKLWFQIKFNILSQLNCNIGFVTYAWKLSRVNNVPNKASHLQPIDHFWELQPIIYHDFIFVNLDIESKAGQYPKPTFLMEVLGT